MDFTAWNKQLAEHDFLSQWQLYYAPERDLLPDKISLAKIDSQNRNDMESLREDKFSKLSLFTSEIGDRLNQSFMSLEPYQQIIDSQVVNDLHTGKMPKSFK
ncbi:hypothetical protein [Parasitella parasitica]|uniref:Uncharacterized protein n=1 Tax=Parasitella parasitica TaxID=35722 RepID=A0A0B7NNQ8_9FUNG|nr:hypothetical protein [Parasitella parasitica]